ncbi:DUF1217 domain-containing protein [Pseudooceanicola sp. 216_PA32_1]|uniref:DUF1217 domain-containing protein n=1 Tax=Pseudooceanicola pacificus TaxID=2676438 RepID=A0A844WBI9_9RHOB|nr:DUF1217 domain-containing protein [Pseudooceanicola pacificus]MWB76650.1 DUF1217 domain-containing protein [Pseudooceanicola pacificus]
MTYAPVVPLSGLAGWRFLQRTADQQEKAFSASADIQRDTDYFKAKIGEIDTAEQLVADRRLLRVALGAFGLQDDIQNRYFICKILEDGTLNTDALANRLADDRYKAFSSAFGFGNFDTPSTKISDFGDEIVAKFRKQQFEAAVGEQDNSMRLALNAMRELGDIAGGSAGDRTKWFKVLGTPPLRQVFETAFGLPSSFAQIDIDKQLEIFRDRAESAFGSAGFDVFQDEAQREVLVQKFLVRSQIDDITAAGTTSSALTIMQSNVAFARSLRANFWANR